MAKKAKQMVVCLEIEDEVTDVITKMGRKGASTILLVVPDGAVIFQSVINLELLKKEADKKEKEVFLITKDPRGKHLAKKAGIEVYNQEEGFTFFGNEKDTLSVPRGGRLRNNRRRRSEGEAPRLMKEKKIAISEILDHSHTLVKEREKGKGGPKKERKMKKLKIDVGNRKALASLILASLMILIFILYIALPGATIILVPTASQLEKSLNVNFYDFDKNTRELNTKPINTVASYPIEIEVERKVLHQATGKRVADEFSNSSGVLTIINTEQREWPLVNDTRFATKDGVVFRIQTEVIVPSATADGPGTIEALVVADEKDLDEQLIGERGNVGPSQFYLPGLSESSQSKLYAESYEAFSGGSSDFVKFISEEDLEAAKIRLEASLRESALEELRAAVKEKGRQLGKDDELNLLEGSLDGEELFDVSSINIEVDESLAGQEIESFEVIGRMKVAGVYFNSEEILNLLREELTEKQSPNKQLLEVSNESVSYRVFERDAERGRIKVTANIKGIEQFNIDPDTENGRNLLEKIREHVAGKRIEEAEIFIQNLPEINRVTIESWPAWSPTVPKIEDNIDFEIKEAIEISE